MKPSYYLYLQKLFKENFPDGDINYQEAVYKISRWAPNKQLAKIILKEMANEGLINLSINHQASKIKVINSKLSNILDKPKALSNLIGIW